MPWISTIEKNSKEEGCIANEDDANQVDIAIWTEQCCILEALCWIH